jgi:hypothetical protein
MLRVLGGRPVRVKLLPSQRIGRLLVVTEQPKPEHCPVRDVRPVFPLELAQRLPGLGNIHDDLPTTSRVRVLAISAELAATTRAQQIPIPLMREDQGTVRFTLHRPRQPQRLAWGPSVMPSGVQCGN